MCSRSSARHLASCSQCSRLCWRITQDDYDKKARELKEQQAEIATRIEQHQQGNAEYRTTLESLISLASDRQTQIRLRSSGLAARVGRAFRRGHGRVC